MSKRLTDINSITNDFLTLINTVKAQNPQATIVICDSIPQLGRPGTWSLASSSIISCKSGVVSRLSKETRPSLRTVIFFFSFSKEWQAVACLYRWDGCVYPMLASSRPNSAWSRRSPIPTSKEEEPASVLVPDSAPSRSEGTSYFFTLCISIAKECI